MGRVAAAIVDSMLRVEGEALPDGMVEEIIDRLTIVNVAKEEAEENEDPEAKNMPDFLELWEKDGDKLVMPRGFAFDLAELCLEYEMTFQWQDKRTMPKGFRRGNSIDLKPEQIKIVEMISETDQGIIMSPTGSGKTVAMLVIFQNNPGSGIVVVNTKEIAAQWINRCKQWLGEDYPVSLIGDGKFEIAERGLTVAIQGTLWSRREELRKQGFFKRFVVAALDECHHVTARTYNEIFNEFTAKVRMGASATPEKTGEFELAKAVVGPIVVEITEEDVGENITKPIVEVIETRLGVEGGDKKGKGKKVKAWARRKSYETLLKKLVTDENRTDLIAEEIMINHFDNSNLVISKRIGHLEEIYEALLAHGFPEDRLLAMVGAHKVSERSEAIELTEEANCVLLTTLADEALDAPRLDRLHITFPTKNPDLVIQQIGRIRRTHPDKVDSIILDYRDRQVDVFEGQYMSRRWDVYEPRKFKIIKRKASDPHARH